MIRFLKKSVKRFLPCIYFVAGCLCTVVFLTESKLNMETEQDSNASPDSQREESPVQFLPLTATLPPAQFSGNWTEDPRMANFRKYSVPGAIPPASVLRQLKPADVRVMLHSYLDNSNFHCHRKLRMGLVGDNGWEVCDDIEWRPIRPCIVYSFGINYDFSFDDDAGRIYGCDVYSFDPSMDKQTTGQRSARVMFYRLGVSGQSGGLLMDSRGPLYSFSDFRRMLNHTHKVIDVVKMDIERYEFGTLETMIKERQLHNIRQLLVEYHVYADYKSRILEHLLLFQSLEQVGFRKFYITKNGAAGCSREVAGFPVMRTKCYEVHYVNVNFKRTTE